MPEIVESPASGGLAVLRELRSRRPQMIEDLGELVAVESPSADRASTVGGNPHAEGEWVDLAAMGDRAALLAVLVDRLLKTADPARPDGAEGAR